MGEQEKELKGKKAEKKSRWGGRRKKKGKIKNRDRSGGTRSQISHMNLGCLRETFLHSISESYLILFRGGAECSLEGGSHWLFKVTGTGSSHLGPLLDNKGEEEIARLPTAKKSTTSISLLGFQDRSLKVTGILNPLAPLEMLGERQGRIGTSLREQV